MADSDKEVTYSDDEFGSDGENYETEYEEQEDENEAAQATEELPPYEHDVIPVVADAEETEDTKESKVGSDALQGQPTMDHYDGEVEESVDGKPAEPTPDVVTSSDAGSSTVDEETARSGVLNSTATTPPIELTVELVPDMNAQRIESTALLSEASEISVASAGEYPEEKEVVDNPPRLLGQLEKPASVRSLSVPVVPAASLVDPSLLAPSNFRSTSVPVVPSNEIIGIHRQNSGHFQIETVTGNTARHKSIVRLPSVEELEAQGAMNSDEESEGDSESDDGDDSCAATPSSPLSAVFTRNRSSSFQLNQPKISPVLRAKSQPFMARLPSVIEVTAEEIPMIESMRDGEGETKSDEEKSSELSEEETAMNEWGSSVKLDVLQNEPTLSGVSIESNTPDAEVNTIAATSAVGDVSLVQMGTNLPTGSTEVLELTEALISGYSQESSEPGDGYDDEYEDQRQSDITKHVVADSNGVTENKNSTENQEMLSKFDEFYSVEETNYNDDEYEGENEEFSDLQFEDESRRETELLLREAQMLIQKQHEDRFDSMLLSTIKSRSPNIPDQSELPDTFEPTILSPTEYEDIEEAIMAARASSTTVPNFEDQYGGEDEFVNADEEGDGEDFDQYASNHDRDNANDVDEPQEPEKIAVEQKPSEDAVLSDSTLISDAESPASVNTPELVAGPVTDIQIGAIQPEASQIGNTPESESTKTSQHATSTDLPPVLTLGDCPKETGQVENSEPAAIEATSSANLQQKSKLIARHDTAATQKPPRVISTRPSRPKATAVLSVNEPRTARPARPATERREVETARSVLKRERPRELRLKAGRSDAQSTTTQGSSRVTPRSRSAQTPFKEKKAGEPDIGSATPKSSSTPPSQKTNAEMQSANSPGRETRRSPERTLAYTPRVYVEEYEPPPPKAPVFKQKHVNKPRAEDSRRKLQPVKSPPNLRIDLPSMDKAKRNWLFLNMFRHGDDVSKYETFVPKLVSPCLTQAAGRPMRPHSISQQTYANSQAEAIAAYSGGRHSRNGRKLVQQDPALREKERNWVPIKPHESAIPAYDSILDKFCTTVTSPVIQRQIYQTSGGAERQKRLEL